MASIFQRRQSGHGDLPFASGGRAPPKVMRQMPQIRFIHVISWGWTILALLLCFISYWHCRSRSEITSLTCDMHTCTYLHVTGGRVSDATRSFPRDDLVRAETVKLKNKEIVSGKSLPRQRRKQKSLGSSYAITYKLDDEGNTQQVPMSRSGMGRRIPKEGVQKINKYIRREVDVLSLKEENRITALGIVCGIFGGLLLLLRGAVGNLQSGKAKSGSKRVKKRY